MPHHAAYICCIIMRTTLILNDELLDEARRRAAERRISVSALINEALRAGLRSAPAEPGTLAFSMPTFRPASGPRRDTSPEALHDLLAAEDSGPYAP